jgi:hypothetical protein
MRFVSLLSLLVFTFEPWAMTVKRTDGKVDAYNAFYEMTRGGRVLRLSGKQHSGMTYSLVRETE